MSNKSDVYRSEYEKLDEIKSYLVTVENEDSQTKEVLNELVNSYDDLLGQVRLITRISDRLQKKLNAANDKLEDQNEQLNAMNDQLRKTINDLVEARLSKKATTIVMISAVALFILSEAFLEPWIDSYAFNHFAKGAFYIGLGIKAVIAISIKPLESLLERRLISRARKDALDSPEMVQTPNI